MSRETIAIIDFGSQYGQLIARRVRENKVYQIGNVRDWYPDYPDVFIASAVANVSMAGYLAARDLTEGKWKAGTITKIGLENPNAVSLPMAPRVSQEVDGKLPENFAYLPRTPYGISRVQDQIAPKSTTAYYQPGNTGRLHKRCRHRSRRPVFG